MRIYNIIVEIMGCYDCTLYQGGFETLEEAAKMFEIDKEYIRNSTTFSNPRIMEIVVENGKVCFKEV
jgi:hypothetical protein